jgi:hypothetical protein
MGIAEYKFKIPKPLFGCPDETNMVVPPRPIAVAQLPTSPSRIRPCVDCHASTTATNHRIVRIVEAVLATMALLIGGMIYVLWRSGPLLMFSWFDAIGLGKLVYALHDFAVPYSHAFPSWVYFSLPEGLWLLSGILYLHCIWRNGSTFGYVLWTSIIVAVAFGYELGQYIHLVPGCFDTLDLIFLAAASVPACVLILFRLRRERSVTV